MTELYEQVTIAPGKTSHYEIRHAGNVLGRLTDGVVVKVAGDAYEHLIGREFNVNEPNDQLLVRVMFARALERLNDQVLTSLGL